ncbi:MAG: hypothetical protein Q4G21_03570 [Dermabacter sp.]|nr:hypothetical protein [Dermabacter sp.]
MRAAAVLVACMLLALTGCASSTHGIRTEVAETYRAAHRSSAEDLKRQQRDIAILEWAAELGIDTDPELATARGPGQREAEAPGKDGSQAWTSHIQRVELAEHSIVALILAELTEAEVREYYDRHLSMFARQDILMLEVTEWENSRAVGTVDLQIDESNIRALSESDELLVSAAVNLHQGDNVTIHRGTGRFAQVQCVSREPGGSYAFDEVVQAASFQLAAERFEAHLKRRVSELP